MDKEAGSGYEIRTRVSALRGLRPGPLDESANVCIPEPSSSTANPGSYLRGSTAGTPNESDIRTSGIQTPVCGGDVLSRDAELSSPQALRHAALARIDAALVADYPDSWARGAAIAEARREYEAVVARTVR